MSETNTDSCGGFARILDSYGAALLEILHMCCYILVEKCYSVSFYLFHYLTVSPSPVE